MPYTVVNGIAYVKCFNIFTLMVKYTIRALFLFHFIFGVNFCLKAQPGNLPTPYCMPLYGQSPCNQPGPSNMPGNFLNDFIHSVLTFSGNVDINNPNTGCNAQNFPSIGFRNYIYHKCQHNLSVNAGQVVSFSVQIGLYNAQGVSVWIDWNGDNVFSAAPEKIGWSTGTVPAGGWLTFTTTIPPTQASGVYRMRVRCAYLANGSTLDPCTNYSCGETEDYDVYVGSSSPVLSNVVASSNSTLCSGNTLSLNVTYSSQCTPSFTWAGPNAFTLNSQNPTITNAQPIHSGNYTVTVSCGTLCPVVVTTSVNIAQAPTTANAGANQCICATSTNLNGNTPAIGTGSWTLISGGATIVNPTSPNTNIVGVAVGANVFAWTITNGPCTSVSTVTITRGQNPTTSVAGPNQTITCTTNTATMQGNTPAIGIGTWSVVSGSGTFASPNSPNSIVTGVGTGTNVYQWTISGGCCSGPVSTSTMMVVNITSINVTATSSSSLACPNFSVSISASGATNYTWTGTSFTGNIVAPNISVPAGTYQVLGETGNCTNTTAVVIGTDNPISIGVSQSSFTICPGKQVNLSASGANSYNWLPCINLSSCSGSTVSATPSVTTQYTINGSTSSCTGSAVISVTFIPSPTVTASSSSSLICAGDQATLTANGATNYTWLPSGNGSTIAISPTTTTIYTVTGAMANGCLNTVTISQNVSPCTQVIDQGLINGIRVYPNPTGDVLNFNVKARCEIKMYDLEGKLVLQRVIMNGDKVDVSELSKGVYMLYFDKDIDPVKIIKE